MQLPHERWLDAAGIRHSRRAYDGTRIDAATLDSIGGFCAEFRPYVEARAVLVKEPSVNVFKGILGSYGRVHGAPSVLVFIAAEEGSPLAQRRCGYTGQAVVLEATALGLGTCWVGGFFDPGKAKRLVTLAPGERIVAVSPLGRAVAEKTATERTMSGLAGSHERKALELIAPGCAEWPEWARAAAKCARIAPSAVNRQPWRLHLEGDSLAISKDRPGDLPRVTKDLDIGIASLHAELGALGAGVAGTWSDGSHDGLEVCRFTPEREV